MTVLYKAEIRGDNLVVKLEEKGTRRVLYLDTLKSIAKEIDKKPLELLIKIHLAASRNPSTSFQQIIIPKEYRSEVLKLMAETGKLTGDLPFLKKTEEAPLTVFPKLVLKDASGATANLFMNYGIGEIPFEDFAPTIKGRPRLKKEELNWEKDLIEAGFTRKMMAGSNYYCPMDQIKKTLRFLLELGWQMIEYRGKKVILQTDLKVNVSSDGGMIVVDAKARFGEKECSLTETSRTWIDLDHDTVGLITHVPEIIGRLKKGRIGALTSLLETATWDEELRALAVGLKAGASLELTPPGPSFKGTLLPYQQTGLDWLSFLYKFGFSGLLADEMGLGKTVQVLAFLSTLGKNLPVLIVAPTSLLFNWRAEIKRFLGDAPQITLTSYTRVRLNEEEYAKTHFEAIVLDESNAIKTSTTQTAIAAYKLKANFKIALSGTPIENRSDELHSQFQFLMPDLIDKGDLKSAARSFILRRKKEDVQLDLPEKIEQIVWVEMDEEQRLLYESYRTGSHETHMEILEAILRLRQICCDPRLVGQDIGSAKFQKMMEDLEEALSQKRKVLIFSQFTSMLKLIRQKFPDALYLDGSTSADERGEQVRRFQEGEELLFLLSLKAGGVGLNLTAADYVFLFDPWWNDAVEAQAISRAHRIGQKKSVIAKRYLTVDTLEEKMLQLKSKKQQTADELLEGHEGWSEQDLLYLLQ